MKPDLNCSFIIPATKTEEIERLTTDLNRKFSGFEVIPIYGATSFFDAWEKGLQKAKKHFLVLTHQDTIFHAFPDFEQIFKGNVGLVGVAGCTQIDKSEPWWFSQRRFREGLLSGRIYHDGPESKGLSVFGPYGEVAVLDGVCLVTTKEIMNKVGIPKTDWGTWDFYDHIISREFIQKGYKLLTVPIVMTHFSAGGNKRPSFYTDMERFVKEYLSKDEVPINIHNKQAYLDIMRDILKKKDGLFSFTLRINSKCIVDYVHMDYVNYKE